MSQPWRAAIIQWWAVPSSSLSCSLSLSLSIGYATSPGALWLLSSSSNPLTHTHIILMIYCHTPLCVYSCLYARSQVNMCAHMCSVCMAAATSNTLKQRSSETLPHPFSFPHRHSNAEKSQHFKNLKKLINKSKGMLHLAQCLRLGLPSLCLGRRSGGTGPESAWKH